MAKKKAAGDFVLTGAVRDVLKRQPELKATEVIEVLRKENPGQRINEASAKVAFSNERRKLGITTRRRRRVRRPRGVAGVAARRTQRAMNFDVLQAAKNFIAAAGSSENAIAAIKQVTSLQVR